MEALVYSSQRPLRVTYKTNPDRAVVTDHARTCGESPSDPFHSKVQPMDGCGIVVPVGTHAAVGGPHDAPTPGDLLCAALSACQDSTFRMVANLLGIEITNLEVLVTATVDVRGSLAMDSTVPVGFQSMTCTVRFAVKEGTPPDAIQKLQASAQQCCIVQQTMKSPPVVITTFEPLDT